MTTYSEEAITAGLLAVIGTTSYAQASTVAAASGHEVPESTLRRWCTEQHVVRFEKLREAWAPKIEAQLANNLLDNARLAAETERLAIEQAKAELESDGGAKEPAKIARDLSQVKAQSIDKRLALQGRPTEITERRDTREIVRALVGMGVVQVAEQPHVPDATAASIRPRQIPAPEPVVLEQDPAKGVEDKKRAGALVWNDELGEQVWESFPDSGSVNEQERAGYP